MARFDTLGKSDSAHHAEGPTPHGGWVPPFAVGGCGGRTPPTAKGGFPPLLRWVAAASCLPHPLHIIWQIVMKIPASDSGGWGGVGWVLLHTTPPHPLHTVMYTIKYSMPAPTHGKRGNPPTMVGGPPCMVCRVQFPHS